MTTVYTEADYLAYLYYADQQRDMREQQARKILVVLSVIATLGVLALGFTIVAAYTGLWMP